VRAERRRALVAVRRRGHGDRCDEAATVGPVSDEPAQRELSYVEGLSPRLPGRIETPPASPERGSASHPVPARARFKVFGSVNASLTKHS
jgi:hypothetical protein